MKKLSILLFVAVSILELTSQVVQLPELHHIVKPLLMITLGMVYFFGLSSEDRTITVWAALLFSFLGDSFLLYESKNEVYFMLGLASFLIAHIGFILAFRQHRSEDEGEQIHTIQKARMAFPVILAATGLVIVLFPHLGDLRVPVVIYAGVLMFMVLNALFRYRRTSDQSYWLVFAGAVLFMISDSVLAIGKFLEPMQWGGVIVMSTYIAAQFLIIEGLITHQRSS
jgi:uncharacterized membrane protein YhhN